MAQRRIEFERGLLLRQQTDPQIPSSLPAPGAFVCFCPLKSGLADLKPLLIPKTATFLHQIWLRHLCYFSPFADQNEKTRKIRHSKHARKFDSDTMRTLRYFYPNKSLLIRMGDILPAQNFRSLKQLRYFETSRSRTSPHCPALIREKKLGCLSHLR